MYIHTFLTNRIKIPTFSKRGSRCAEPTRAQSSYGILKKHYNNFFQTMQCCLTHENWLHQKLQLSNLFAGNSYAAFPKSRDFWQHTTWCQSDNSKNVVAKFWLLTGTSPRTVCFTLYILRILPCQRVPKSPDLGTMVLFRPHHAKKQCCQIYKKIPSCGDFHIDLTALHFEYPVYCKQFLTAIDAMLPNL